MIKTTLNKAELSNLKIEKSTPKLRLDQIEKSDAGIFDNTTKIQVIGNMFKSNLITDVSTDQQYLTTGSNFNLNLARSESPLIREKKKVRKVGEISQYIFGLTPDIFNVTFMDTKKYEFLHTQFMMNVLMQAVFSLISILSAIVNYEVEYYRKSTNVSLLALWICFISSIMLWMTIVFDYLLECTRLHQIKKLPENLWRKDKGLLMDLCLTLIVVLVHPNPVFYGIEVDSFIDKYNVTVKYPLNAYMTLICLLRCWYLLKFYIISSEFYTPRTQRICEMNSFDTTISFSVKGLMQMNPYNIYAYIFAIVIFYCSFCLRMFERTVDSYSGLKFDNYWNSLWCLVITMTTVGYGDISPSTFEGRMVGIAACFCGVFLISMLIVTITNVLELNGIERNIYLIMERTDLMSEKDLIAAKLVSLYIKLMKNIKKKRKEIGVRFHEEKAIKEMREALLMQYNNFKHKLKEIQATFPPYTNLDNIIDNLNYLDSSMSTIKKKMNNLESLTSKIADKLNII